MAPKGVSNDGVRKKGVGRKTYIKESQKAKGIDEVVNFDRTGSPCHHHQNGSMGISPVKKDIDEWGELR